MLKTFRIDRFDGGLNTSTVEANLPPNMSASLLNVDFLDTGALTRRNGYQVQATFGTGEGKALFRYYQADGSRIWVGVCGTDMAYSQWAATQVSWTYLEAEGVNTGGTDYTSGDFSGGAAVSVSASASFAVPMSTEIKTLFRGNWQTGSIKVDAGAWTNISVASGWDTETGLSATAHTVKVKPGGSNTQSVYLEFLGGSPLPAGAYVAQRVYTAYDSQVSIRVRHSYPSARSFKLAARQGADEAASVTVSVSANTWTTLALSNPVDFDNISIYCMDSLAACYVYLDNLITAGAVTWYGQTTSGWTLTTYALSTGVTTGVYDTTQPPVCVDTFHYSAITTPVSATTISNVERIAFAQYLDKVYYGNSTDGLDKFDGTTTAHVNATVKPDFLCVHKDRLFAARDYLLEYTAVGDPEDWTNGSSNNIAASDGGVFCTGLKTLRDSLLWYGANELHAIDVQGDPINWNIRAVSRRYGCVAPRTLADAGNAHIFLSADGVRGYGLIEGIYSDDGSGIVPLSKFINPITVSDPEKACGAFFKGRYWLSDGTSTIYVCDMEKRVEIDNVRQPPWTRYDIAGVTAMCVTEMISSDDHELYALTSNGVLWKLDYGNDDGGSAITMTYIHPPIAVGGYSRTTHFKHVHLSADASVAQSLTFTPSTDDVNGNAFTAALTADTDLQPIRRAIQARGRYIKATLSSEGTGQPLTVHSIEYTYNPRPRLR